MKLKEGDCVIVQTKHYGPYYGIVGAVDPDGSVVVRHDVKRYPEHPSGATYVNAKHLWTDLEFVCPAGGKVTKTTYNHSTGKVTHKHVQP